MILNKSALEVDFPKGIMISDPPYNRGYHYNNYKDNLSDEKYMELLGVFRKPCVVIGYPEMIINIMSRILGEVNEVVCWVYPSNTARQSRLIGWWGCKPDFRKVGQDYKNPTDKRIRKRIAEGKRARLYDWWEINQVKNVSKKDNPHPCPIPEELARRIILTTVIKDQLVIDPFAGSGTILKVAKDNGYNYCGTEIDKTYCKMMEKDLEVSYVEE